jgi:hypothetical protein
MNKIVVFFLAVSFTIFASADPERSVVGPSNEAALDEVAAAAEQAAIAEALNNPPVFPMDYVYPE